MANHRVAEGEQYAGKQGADDHLRRDHDVEVPEVAQDPRSEQGNKTTEYGGVEVIPEIVKSALRGAPIGHSVTSGDGQRYQHAEDKTPTVT